ncbi:uncharacterized protein LOC143182645 [Calliopsis andreniformis]|uniref:uncharacterized protein LOC143182645 n=1 Tax=Calliopsis andreniformis TaxID=337506 RepID=UPI003FCC514B
MASANHGDSANVDSAMTPEVNRVGIRVPPFWPEQPVVWFHQIEAQFALNRATADTTKFYYVMSQLEPKYALEVQDIFTDPPETEKYETLKRELVQRLSTSQGKRIRQLLEQEDVRSDRRSDAFPISSAHEESGRADSVRLFLTNAMVKPVTCDDTRYCHRANGSSAGKAQVASVSTDTVTDVLLKRLESLELKIAELSRSRSTNRPASNFRRRSRSRSAKRGVPPANKQHCWYHRVFGAKSTKCRSPCSYVAGNGETRH